MRGAETVEIGQSLACTRIGTRVRGTLRSIVYIKFDLIINYHDYCMTVGFSPVFTSPRGRLDSRVVGLRRRPLEVPSSQTSPCARADALALLQPAYDCVISVVVPNMARSCSNVGTAGVECAASVCAPTPARGQRTGGATTAAQTTQGPTTARCAAWAPTAWTVARE